MKLLLCLLLLGQLGGYDGCFLGYDTGTRKFQVINEERTGRLYSPCSTFKVPNSLILLQEGAVTERTVLPWDGVKRRYEAWNKDQTLRSAIAASALWAYQKWAEKVPLDVYRRYLTELDYGNADLSGGVAAPFWQTSSLLVSARQQVAFLRSLEAGSLPFEPNYQHYVRDIMILKQGDGWILRGKTGSGVSADGKRMLGWFVGYVTKGSRALIFAANLEGQNTPETEPGGWIARAIVEGMLQEQGWLPAPPKPATPDGPHAFSGPRQGWLPPL